MSRFNVTLTGENEEVLTVDAEYFFIDDYGILLFFAEKDEGSAIPFQWTIIMAIADGQWTRVEKNHWE